MSSLPNFPHAPTGAAACRESGSVRPSLLQYSKFDCVSSACGAPHSCLHSGFWGNSQNFAATSRAPCSGWKAGSLRSSTYNWPSPPHHPASEFPEVPIRHDLDECATRITRPAHEISQPTIRSIEARRTVLSSPPPGRGNCAVPDQRHAGQTQRRTGFRSAVPVPALRIHKSGRQPRLPPVRTLMLCRTSLAADYHAAWLQSNTGGLRGRHCHE